MTHHDVVEMPVEEKLKLMESLWDSLCSTVGEKLSRPAWHDEILAERLRRLDSGEDVVSPWSDAKERIRNLTKSP